MKTTFVLVMMLVAPAAAEHDHGGHDHPAEPEAAPVSASIGVVAAAYESMLFEGSYQGVVGTARYTHGRFGAMASIASYRITKNGRAIRGIGDTIVGGDATLLARDGGALGVALALGLPTGNDVEGLGMGHYMAMPGVWASYTTHDLTLSLAATYHRGIGDESIHAAHGGGAWPLVEPMNYQEATMTGGLAFQLARVLRSGVRFAGAAPIGDGDARLTAAWRTVWTQGRIETTFEIGAGLVGDPYSLRGMLETGVRFF
ncbi:MAG: hypothetical protein ABI867_09860 [Kofleriaceae bacterium]